jgi:hypothetical protein
MTDHMIYKLTILGDDNPPSAAHMT